MSVGNIKSKKMIQSRITKGKQVGIHKVQILDPTRSNLRTTNPTNWNQEGMELRISKVTSIQVRMAREVRRRGCLQDATIAEEITMLTNALVRQTPTNYLDHHNNMFTNKGFTWHLTIDRPNNR